jgi:hypothetical protein
MQSLAAVQSVAPTRFMRLFAPPLLDSQRPSLDATLYDVPFVHLKAPPLQVAVTLPPVPGFSAPKLRVDDASITTHVPVTEAETLIW